MHRHSRPGRAGIAAIGLTTIVLGGLITGCQDLAGPPADIEASVSDAAAAKNHRGHSHPRPTTATATTEPGAVGEPTSVTPRGTTRATTTTARPPLPPTRPVTAGQWWRPKPGLTWQWQLNGDVDKSVNAQVFDIDLIHSSAKDVADLHARGAKVICYVNAGAVEDYRPDARSFPASVGGGTNGWPGEKWLDIRRIDVLKPIMAARFDLCKQKGFDGVEPDLVDGYAHKTGFPLTAADQLRYNRMLADLAHERGLAIGLKNDLDQVKDLVDTYDFAVNEQCAEYNECHMLSPFIAAGKAVFHAEYSVDPGKVCDVSRRLGLSSIMKDTSLNATPRRTC